jgi:hypothetical protein
MGPEKRLVHRLVAACGDFLVLWWGVTRDEGRYFLLIGFQLGSFGWEGECNRAFSDAEFTKIAEDTKEKLRKAGFDEAPALHFQFEPDY